MRILGHRGASEDFPENTLEAFLGALQQGADGVELDVMPCATGELVVCHDEVLERLAGLKLEVAHTRWERLKTVDVGTRLGFPLARLPRLEEVFEALPASAAINVELKVDTADDRGLASAVGRLVVEQGLEGRVVVSSFNALALLRLARGFPQLRRGYLLDPAKAWAVQAWGWLPLVARTSVHPHFSACTPARVNRWHARGWEVVAWTVDEPEEARRLRAMGVDALITNRPGALRRELTQPRR